MYRYTYCIEFLYDPFKHKKYYGKRRSIVKPEKDTQYRGSGVVPSQYFSIYKNDENSYIKTILGSYSSEEELTNAEQELLNKHVGKDYCVNINIGSNGGVYKHRDDSKEKCRISNLGARWMTNGKVDKYVVKDKINKYLKLGYTFGRIYKLPEETRKLINEKLKGKTSWLKNNHLPDYCRKHLSELNKDTKLMNNGERHKLVKYNEIESYLANGWKFGYINKICNKDKCVRWITNGKENKRVKTIELEKYFSMGYYSGRMKNI